MHQGQSNYPKLQFHEKTLSTVEIVRASWKLSGVQKRDQSLFSLLLEIENRLRTEARNDQIEQRQRSRANNLSRYCE
jgi:ABC-type transporter Mla MlaB component